MNLIIIILLIAIFCRLGGCDNADKNNIEKRLERIEQQVSELDK